MISIDTWKEGYVSDVSYVTNFYSVQCPDFLNFCTLLYGFDPPDINKPFNYCELGSGNGYTSNIMAALYPHGNFYAIDFNPTHIQFSNKIKEASKLTNIRFYEMSFKELAELRLEEFPEFDFITLHGVLSWINHDNRMNIMKFIERKLKPGGMVYISYNNMCGWFTRIPLQRFIVDYCELFPDVFSIKKLKNAMDLIHRVKDVGASYFNFPPITKTLSQAEHSSLNYLVHEYLNKDWQPLFFSQVLSYAKDAKLVYCGTAEPVWRFEDVLFAPKHIELLNSLRSNYLREIVKDFMVSMAFRKDIYMRGNVFLPDNLLLEKIMNSLKLVLRKVPEDKKYKIELPYVQKNANIDPKIIDGIFDKLSSGPVLVKEFLKDLFPETEPVEFLKIISILIHARMLDPVVGESDNLKSSLALNKVIAKHARYYNILKVLVFPLGRAGILTDIVQRLVFDALVNEGKEKLEDLISHVYFYLKDRKIFPEEGEDLKDLISEKVALCIEKELPFWEKNKII